MIFFTTRITLSPRTTTTAVFLKLQIGLSMGGVQVLTGRVFKGSEAPAGLFNYAGA